MSGRTHDHYCPDCASYFSPFDFPECPGCGHPGIYDLNHELCGDVAEDE